MTFIMAQLVTDPVTPLIPFNQPAALPGQWDRMRALLENKPLLGNGAIGQRCEALLAERLGSPVLLTTSATHALEMMALLIGIAPGDEVLVPSFTFVSSANAFALYGAVIRFVEIDSYGNLDLEDVERKISTKTKAVVAIHYAGASADMQALTALCDKKGVLLLEDAAQAIDGSYRGKALGTFGALGCLSFHETKNITSGEGGALIVNRKEWLERALIIRDKGTNRSQFYRGFVDKYNWMDLGSSYVLSELNAAYLLPQVEQLDAIQTKRRELKNRYQTALVASLAKKDIQLLGTPPGCADNAHIAALLFQKEEQRDAYIDWMKAQRVLTPFHYVPLHRSPFGKKFFGENETELFRTLDFSSRLVRLPLFFNLQEAEQDRVIALTLEFVSRLG